MKRHLTVTNRVSDLPGCHQPRQHFVADCCVKIMILTLLRQEIAETKDQGLTIEIQGDRGVKGVVSAPYTENLESSFHNTLVSHMKRGMRFLCTRGLKVSPISPISLMAGFTVFGHESGIHS